MKRCSKCGHSYDDSWGICLKCNIPLTPMPNDVSAQPSLTKEGNGKSAGIKYPPLPKLSTQQRAANMAVFGIGLCAFSLLYAVASEGFGYNILTQTLSSKFRFYGLANVYGIVLAYLAPFGGIGLILLYRGKSKLQKNKLFNRLFLLFLSPIVIGVVVIFLLRFGNL